MNVKHDERIQEDGNVTSWNSRIEPLRAHHSPRWIGFLLIMVHGVFFPVPICILPINGGTD
jgi:hypothetical protein